MNIVICPIISLPVQCCFHMKYAESYLISYELIFIMAEEADLILYMHSPLLGTRFLGMGQSVISTMGVTVAPTGALGLLPFDV